MTPAEPRLAEPGVEPADLLLRRLLALTSLLADAASSAEVTRLVVEVATGIFGGVTGSLCTLSDDGLHLDLVADVGSAASLEERWSRFAVDAPTPAGEAMATGRPVLLASLAERDERFPVLRGAPAADQAYAILPLPDEDGAAFGVLTVGFPAARSFHDADVEFLGALAQQCALALLRARRLDARRAERLRAELLAACAAASVGARTVEEAAVAFVRALVPAFADHGAVDLVQGGAVRRYTSEGGDEEVRTRWQDEERAAPLTVEDDTPVASVLRGEGPIHIRDIDDEVLKSASRSPELHALLVGLDLRSAIVVPVVSAAVTMGALTLINTRTSPQLERDDLTFAGAVAAQLATTLANVRAFEREHRIAETLQRSLLPAGLPAIPGLRLASRYEPSNHLTTVGGDWYDAFERPDGTFVLCVGDIAGHDIEAAAAMGQLRNAVRVYALDHADPATVFAHLDRLVRAYDITELATCVLAVWHPATWTLRYGHAGHPPLLVAGGDGSSRLLEDGRGPVLGAGMGGPFATGTVALEPGDAVLLYSDGLLERRGSDLGTDLERLRHAAGGLERTTIDGLCAELLHRMVPPTGWADDVAMLAARRPRS